MAPDLHIHASPAAVRAFVVYVAGLPCVQPCEPGDPCVPCWARGLLTPVEAEVASIAPSGGRVTGGG